MAAPAGGATDDAPSLDTIGVAHPARNSSSKLEALAAAPSALTSGEESVGVLRAEADRAEELLASALEYEVLRARDVFDAPSVLSNKVSQHRVGDVVWGLPAGLCWIRLVPASSKAAQHGQRKPAAAAAAGAPQWMRVHDDSDGGQFSLRPLWSSLRLAAAFAEALALEWDGLPALPEHFRAAYSVEWRSGGREAVPARSGHKATLQCCATLNGLPSSADVQARVTVRVDSVELGGQGFRLEGPWAAFRTREPVPADAPLSRRLDPFGQRRLGYSAVGCRDYYQAEYPHSSSLSPMGSSSLLELTVCYRCGHAFDRHSKGYSIGAGEGGTIVAQEQLGASRGDDGKAAKAKAGGDGAPSARAAKASPSSSSFRVAVRGVFIREGPSVSAACVGALTLGASVTGVVEGDWLRLDQQAKERCAPGSSGAFVLINGRQLGLGALLVPTAAGAGGGAVDEGDGKQADTAQERGGKGASAAELELQAQAEELKQALGGTALDFTVVAPSTVALRRAPSWSSPVLRSLELEAGEALRGHPAATAASTGASWLRLEEQGGKQVSWAPLHGNPGAGGASNSSTNGSAIEPAWGRVAILARFIEALEVQWPGLPAPVAPEAQYIVEWRRAREGDDRSGGAGGGTLHAGRIFKGETRGVVHRLPPAEALRLRVVATIPWRQGRRPLQLVGPWCETSTLEERPKGARVGGGTAAAPLQRESVDPFGTERGSCSSSGCRGYCAPDAFPGFVNSPTAVLCRCCGLSVLEHRKLGSSFPSKKPAAPAAGGQTAAEGGQQQQQQAAPAFRVQHRAVVIRDAPSTKGLKLGLLLRGQTVRGERVKEGLWLRLMDNDTVDLGIPEGQAAWVLIDGAEVGLGALLTPLAEKPAVAEHEKDDSDDDDQDAEADRALSAFSAPLEYIVVHKTVAVRRKPRIDSKLLGVLSKGAIVRGFPDGNWLQLHAQVDAKAKQQTQKPPQQQQQQQQDERPQAQPEPRTQRRWVRIDGTDLGFGVLLRPRLAIHVQRAFAEALSVKWDTVPARSADYSVEWMLHGQAATETHVAVMRSSASSAVVRGLRANTPFKLRVKARVLGQGTAKGGAPVVAEVVSDWTSAVTGPAITPSEEASRNFDPLAKLRGKCGACPCRRFVLAKYSDLMNLSHVACRRCGCSCTAHEVIGIWQDDDRRPGGKAGEEQQQHQRRFFPGGANSRQDHRKVRPHPGPAELRVRTWTVDEADASADPVRHVVGRVRVARNLYETLGVAVSAGKKKIRLAYRQISLRIHPDKVRCAAHDVQLPKDAEAAFKLVAAAYEILGDDGKRAAYDRTLRASQQHAEEAPSGCWEDAGGEQAAAGPTGTPFSAHAPGRHARQGASYSRSSKVQVTVRHRSEDDVLEFSINSTTTVFWLTRAIVNRIQRGPPEIITLSDASGTPLEDGHRFSGATATIYCDGVSFGPPQPVSVRVRDATTGAICNLKLLDTATLVDVMDALALEQNLEAADLELGHRDKVSRKFRLLRDGERLYGRTLFWVRFARGGKGTVISFSVQQATALQRSLLKAYGEPGFQGKMDELLATYPASSRLRSTKFRQQFAHMVREAQQHIMAEWGFDGDFGAHHMLAAFNKVAEAPEVKRLTAEIDGLLRITKGGMMVEQLLLGSTGASARETEAGAKRHGDAETGGAARKPPAAPEPVRISVRQAVLTAGASASSEPPPALSLTLPSNSTFGDVRAAVAQELGLESTSGLRLVFRLRPEADVGSMGSSFLSFKDEEQIGKRRELLMLGVDLANLPARAPSKSTQLPQASSRGRGSAISQEEALSALQRMQELCGSEQFQLAVAGNSARVGFLFATFCGGVVADLGFSCDQAGFTEMFTAISKHGEDPEVRAGAVAVERLLHAEEGSWFRFLQSEGESAGGERIFQQPEQPGGGARDFTAVPAARQMVVVCQRSSFALASRWQQRVLRRLVAVLHGRLLLRDGCNEEAPVDPNTVVELTSIGATPGATEENSGLTLNFPCGARLRIADSELPKDAAKGSSRPCAGALKRALLSRCANKAANAHIRLARRISPSMFVPLPDDDDAAGGQASEIWILGASPTTFGLRPELPDLRELSGREDAKEAFILMRSALEIIGSPVAQETLAALDAGSCATLLAWQPPPPAVPALEHGAASMPLVPPLRALLLDPRRLLQLGAAGLRQYGEFFAGKVDSMFEELGGDGGDCHADEDEEGELEQQEGGEEGEEEEEEEECREDDEEEDGDSSEAEEEEEEEEEDAAEEEVFEVQAEGDDAEVVDVASAGSRLSAAAEHADGEDDDDDDDEVIDLPE